MKKLLTLVLLLVTVVCARAQLSNAMDMSLRKLSIAQLAISSLYVDSVNENKLTESAIEGMLKSLDPHSSYTNAEETRKLNEPLEGNFEGIGVQYNMLEDTLVVIQTVAKGPSEKVGILAGDRIISVDDTIIAGVKRSRDDIMSRLRGPKNSKVRLGVIRRGVKEILYFTVMRDKIPVNSMDAAYMLRPGIGYIRLGNFGATTHKEMTEAIALLEKKGMKKLVLDLQSNGGGYLNAAIDVSNEFLQQGDLIVYTQGRTSPHVEYKAKGGGSFRKGDLVILTDEFTASAAEIVAGGMQDQDRGVIVGRRSFGKGLVQRPIMLPDQSMIRLTVAHYYTPSGRCIQKPYKKGDRADYDLDVLNRFKHGEMMNQDSIHFADSLQFKTLHKKRTVYGGGGIMPDYFIPLDTTRYTKYYQDLRMKSLIVNNSLKYIDHHRAELKAKYKKFEDFDKKYEVPQEQIDALIADGKAMKVEPKDLDELEKTLPIVKLILKALTARDIWDMSEYFQIMNTDNPSVKKALELLK